MSGFNSLDKLIFEAEQAEELKKEKEERKLREFFDKLHIEKLRNKNIKDMSWGEIHNLNEIRKEDEGSELPEISSEDLSPEEMFAKIQELLKKPEVRDTFKSEYPEMFEKWLDIAISRDLAANHFADTTENIIEEISNEKPVTISKSALAELGMAEDCEPLGLKKDDTFTVFGDGTWKKNDTIQKGAGNVIVSGFASVDEGDQSNTIANINILKKSLYEFSDNQTILLNHTERPIGKIINYDMRVKDGKEALYVECELFKDTKDVQDALRKGILKGFSIGGNKDKLFEISLCEEPANPDCTITEVWGL